jgi:hypothetical protein
MGKSQGAGHEPSHAIGGCVREIVNWKDYDMVADPDLTVRSSIPSHLL